MSLKSELIRLSKSGSPQRFGLFDFARWYRDKNFTDLPVVPGVFQAIDELAERSEDYLEQEYARFILETGE